MAAPAETTSSGRRRRLRGLAIVVTLLITGAILNIIIAVAIASRADSVKITNWNGTTSESGLEIRHVAEATRFGSRWIISYRRRYPRWHAMQTTGPPDTYSRWASAISDDQDEWLQLEYKTPIATEAITIYNPWAVGALRRVVGITEDGREIELWRGNDITGRDGVFRRIDVNPPAPLTGVRLHLASPQVYNWNEIDSVGLVDADGREHWAAGAEASSTYIDRASTWYGLPVDPQAELSQGDPDEMLPFRTNLDHPRLPYASGQRNYEYIFQMAFGWPLPSLAVEYELSDSESTLQVNGGIPTGQSLRPSLGAPLLKEMLPYLPLWPGLVANMVFYAVLLRIPFLVARWTIRFRRRRMGLCKTCGYDLRGAPHDVCPECGSVANPVKPSGAPVV